jgi:hypothetical protein
MLCRRFNALVAQVVADVFEAHLERVEGITRTRVLLHDKPLAAGIMAAAMISIQFKLP